MGEARAGCHPAEDHRDREPESGRQGCCPRPHGAAGTWAAPGVDREDGRPRMRRKRKRMRYEPVLHLDPHSCPHRCHCGAASAGKSVQNGVILEGLPPGWGPEGGCEMVGPESAPPIGRKCRAGVAAMGLLGWRVGTV